MVEPLVERLLRRIVKSGVLELVRPDGSLARIGEPAPGFPEVRVRFTDTKVGRQIIRDPRLGAAEAFMDGRLLLEKGEILDLAQLLRANRPWEKGAKLHKPAASRVIIGRLASAVNQVNRRVRSRSNVTHHYDIGNQFYALMLDPEHMQYSCAYWPRTGMTLAEAQEAKLAHIAAKLALSPGQEVLDIGCGWGGMAIYLVRHTGVRVTGITLSKEQLALARTRAEEAGVGGMVRFELCDYRDLPATGRRFDRIVSVGMFEHVGRPQYEKFFHACASLLAEDGVMLLHTIGRFGPPGQTDAFTRKYIFPGGYIPALSETLEASEKVRLIASDVETLRLHYATTLRAWYANCMAHREKIEAIYDARFYRMWTYYLAGATAAFESGSMCNYQIQYTRDRRVLPLTRGYIEESEKALLTGSEHETVSTPV